MTALGRQRVAGPAMWPAWTRQPHLCLTSTPQSPGDSVLKATECGMTVHAEHTALCHTAKTRSFSVSVQQAFQKILTSRHTQGTILPQPGQLLLCIKGPLVHDLVSWELNNHPKRHRSTERALPMMYQEEEIKGEV